MPIDYDPAKEDEKLIPYKKMIKEETWIRRIFRAIRKFLARLIPGRRKRTKKMDYKLEKDESLDWWSKYFASLEVSVHERKSRSRD